MDNASIIRACQAIRACCDLLVDRHGNPVPMCVENKKAIVVRAEDYAARLDNGNREAYSADMLTVICADDYIAETVRYYREQADNFMAEVA